VPSIERLFPYIPLDLFTSLLYKSGLTGHNIGMSVIKSQDANPSSLASSQHSLGTGDPSPATVKPPESLGTPSEIRGAPPEAQRPWPHGIGDPLGPTPFAEAVDKVKVQGHIAGDPSLAAVKTELEKYDARGPRDPARADFKSERWCDPWRRDIGRHYVRPLTPSEQRVIEQEPTVQNVLAAGGTANHVTYALIVRIHELRAELVETRAIIPQRYKLRNGRILRWDCPDDKIPITDL